MPNTNTWIEKLEELKHYCVSEEAYVELKSVLKYHVEEALLQATEMGRVEERERINKDMFYLLHNSSVGWVTGKMLDNYFSTPPKEGDV